MGDTLRFFKILFFPSKSFLGQHPARDVGPETSATNDLTLLNDRIKYNLDKLLSLCCFNFIGDCKALAQ